MYSFHPERNLAIRLTSLLLLDLAFITDHVPQFTGQLSEISFPIQVSHTVIRYIYIYNICHFSNIHSAETKALVRKNKSKFVREYIVRQAWTNMI